MRPDQMSFPSNTNRSGVRCMGSSLGAWTTTATVPFLDNLPFQRRGEERSLKKDNYEKKTITMTPAPCNLLHFTGLFHATKGSSRVVLHLAVNRLLQSIRKVLKKCNLDGGDEVIIQGDNLKIFASLDANILFFETRLKAGRRFSLRLEKEQGVSHSKIILEADDPERFAKDLEMFFAVLWDWSKKDILLPARVNGAGPSIQAKFSFSNRPISFRRSMVKKK